MAKQPVRGVLDTGPVGIDDPAPDFDLPALIGGIRKTFRLADYRGKTLVLAFYPFNWQDASVQQMVAYQSNRSRILSLNAETVAINVESILNTTAWERTHGPFDFPLCSDFWPHGAVSRRYGVLRESGTDAGSSERAVFVVDPNGRIILCKTYDPEAIPPLDEIFSRLQRA